MKRAREEESDVETPSTCSEAASEPSFLIQSLNYSNCYWGASSKHSQAMIVSPKRHRLYIHQVEVKPGIFAFQIVGYTCCYVSVKPGGSLSIDKMNISDSACHFRISRTTDSPFCKISPVAMPNCFIRHSNYLLSASPIPSFNHSNFELDCSWLICPAGSQSTIADISNLTRLHLFLPKPLPDATRCSVLLDFINSKGIDVSGRRSRKPDGYVYDLQGAGAMDGASALDVASPHGPLSLEMVKRIEACSTLSQRGGVENFTVAEGEAKELLRYLSDYAAKHVIKSKVFGSLTYDDFTLGFCEFIMLPVGKEIKRHRDGGSDCDFAAVFCISGTAEVSLVNSRFVLEEADMYVFEPQKYYHAVSKPFNGKPRYVVTLRYFYTN